MQSGRRQHDLLGGGLDVLLHWTAAAPGEIVHGHVFTAILAPKFFLATFLSHENTRTRRSTARKRRWHARGDFIEEQEDEGTIFRRHQLLEGVCVDDGRCARNVTEGTET